jgi:hypothetical protein
LPSPLLSGWSASRLRLRRSSSGSSPGWMQATMRGKQYSSPTLRACSRTWWPAQTVGLVSGCIGILSTVMHFQPRFSERAISPVFSLLTLGHSLWCLSRALRHGAALLLRLSEDLFDKPPHKTRTKRFSEPSAKAPLGTWERGTSRRFAQECPEGNPGKYKQGETQWHSTKTNRN